jgi:peptidoglycan/LPS O-acetylase OafA/YrhL
MGFTIALMSVAGVFRTAERVKLCGVAGLTIAFSAPWISQVDWSKVPWVVRHYIVPDYSTFGLFPWGAYLAFGIAAGSLIRITPQESMDRVMQWAALTGGALIIACQYFSSLPFAVYAKSEYWLNSPAQILTKLGVTLLILALAFIWTRYAAPNGWSWVRQLGTTSLLVYWVHIELVYGRSLWFFKNNLAVGETIVAAVCLILAMLAISLVQTNRFRIRTWFAELAWWLSAKPGRASGD